MLKNFRFEEPGKIALSGFPQTPEEVDWLYDQGIRTVVSYHPIPADVEARLVERGITWRPFLVTDFGEGVPAGLNELFDWLDARSDEDPALMHCQGGGGRAGTMYAAYLITRGVPVEEAMTRVPGITRDVQKAFLYGFAAGRGQG
jgi:hypothetical protein